MAAGRGIGGRIRRRVGEQCPGTPADFGRLPVQFVPWSKRTEADELANSDAGVSWIPDGLWSRGKCGLKVLQYGAAGLPVVTNPVGVHREMIVPGITGYLASTAEEWVEAVKTLRDSAWRFASILALEPGLAHPITIWARDCEVSIQERLVYDTPGLTREIVAAIAARESRDIVKNIRELSKIAKTPAPIKTVL